MKLGFGNFDPVQIQGTITRALGFDLDTLWQLSFGYKGLPFPANILNSNIPGLSGPGKALDKSNLMSRYTGVPLYEKLKGGGVAFMPVWIEDNLLPITRMSIARRKITNLTPMTGKKGSVKELVRADDYEILIQGIAFGHDKIYPEEEIILLEQLQSLNRSLSMRSALTDIFIQDGYAVVTDFRLPPSRSEHVQPWEMKLLSDEIFDLIID